MNYKRLAKIFLVYLFSKIIVLQPVVAQELPTIIPPTPTAASMMNFEELPIDYYTGQPDISIPVFSKKVHKDLGFNLALRYSTQGLKVNSRSSWVGTGWSLDAGGAISRTVRGYVDEDPDWTSYGVLQNDDYWNYRSLDIPSKNEFNWNVLGSRAKKWDSELDLYQFNFMGHSGRFVIIKDAGILKAKLLSIDKHYKIDLAYDPTSLKVSSFTITDTRGYRYTFGKVEVSISDMRSGGIDQNPESPGNISAGSTNTMTYNSAWYLTAVNTSNNIEVMSIEYGHLNYSYENAKTTVDNEIIDWDSQHLIPREALKNDYNNSILKPRYGYSWSGITAQSWYPKTVKFRDSTAVSLQLSPANHPEGSGSILSSIKLHDHNGNEYKGIDFEFDTEEGRLWLERVNETAGGITHSYHLNYQLRNELSQFEGEQDAWGYDPDYSSGVIDEITYPTGGKRQFIFEPHSYSYIGSQVITDYAANTNNETDDNHTFSFQNELIDTESTSGLIDEFNLTFSHAHTASVYVNIAASTNATATIVGPDGGDGLMDATWLKLLDQTGTVVSSVLLNQTLSNIEIPEGSYRVIIETAQRAAYDINGIISLRYKRLISPSNPEYEQEFTGGGFRIKQINLFDDVFDEIPEKSLNYSYADESNPIRSSGAIDALGSRFNSYEQDTKKFVFSGASNFGGEFDPRVIRYRITREGMNVGLSRGGYVTYGRVVEAIEGNGRSEYTYTSAQTHPSNVDSHQYPFPPEPTIDFKRGLLISKKVYDQSNRMLRRETNNYVPASEKIAPWIKVVDQEMCKSKQFYDSYSQYIAENPETTMIPAMSAGGTSATAFGICGDFPAAHIYGFSNDTYDLAAGWAKLTSKIVDSYNYREGQQVKTTTTETYDYNLDNHQVNEVVSTWQENGATASSKTITYYPVGTPAANFQVNISDLQALNMIDMPLRVENYRNDELISATQNEYHFVDFPGKNHPELKRVWAARGSFPLEPKIEFHSYDEFGNILEVSRSGDANHISYLWSYGQTHPIAKIDNATYADLSNIIDLNLLGSTYDESIIQTELNKLRVDPTLQKSFINVYTYTPEYWMQQQSDPNDFKMNYGYDSMGRISEVIDQNGHILNRYEYRYKRQNK